MRPKINVVAGTIIWLCWALWVQPSLIELALAFAFLVLVPIHLYLVVPDLTSSSLSSRLIRWLTRWSLPFALAGIVSLTLSVGFLAGLFAAVWGLFTCAIALSGLLRLMGRGLRPAEEALIDAGLIYISVGGGWLVLSRIGGGDFLPYSQVIVDLTAIHFHYAAFFLPVLTGVFGRWLWEQSLLNKTTRDQNKAYSYLAAGVVSGPFLVAIGLDQGPPLELILVSLYVLIIFGLCGWWTKVSWKLSGWNRWGLLAASFILPATMVLSFLYSLGLALGLPIVSIPEMIRWHGTANAFGFTLLAALTWLYLAPLPRHSYTTFPISRLRGDGYVGDQVLERNDWVDKMKVYTGLISSWEAFKREDFDPERLHPLIRHFYTHTSEYEMHVDLQWERGFRLLSHVSHAITKRMGQINLPPSQKMKMAGQIIPIKDDHDGRTDVRAWVRRNAAHHEPIFTALYSIHKQHNETYANIALPLPRGVMTGILRYVHDGHDGLILTSHKRQKVTGDEGIYLTFGPVTIRTPLEETFHITVTDEYVLRATHKMTVLGIPFMRMEYDLRSTV